MQVKKILFDLAAVQGNITGGGEYAKTVFFKLCTLLRGGNEHTVMPPSVEVFYNPNIHIDNSILETCKGYGVSINSCKNNADISKLLCDKKYDVFYSALPYSYQNLEIPPETKFIYTIHGLRELERPTTDIDSLWYIKGRFKRRIKLLLENSAIIKKYFFKMTMNSFQKLFSAAANQTIITVSNHSKYSISYFFPQLPISQIKVMYSPLKDYDFGKETNSLNILKSLSVEPGKYILLICGDRSVKGAYLGCRILQKLIAKNDRIPQDIKVIVLGATYLKPYRRLVKNNPRFVFHGVVSTGDLETLYKNAHLFLYPTLNEGFGYPPLEAMKYGTLCAVSANSAVTEVCGDAVLYFNPFDETEMGIRVLQSFDAGLRREKSIKMAERFKLVNDKQNQDLDMLVKEIIS